MLSDDNISFANKTLVASNKVMKKIIILASAGILIAILSYKIGYRTGCFKVIGHWEKTDINERILESHCYGDRSMWLDDVERKTEVK